MKTFKNSIAQGDIYIRKIEKLPSDLKPVPAINGKVIVAHSETGHHHYFEETQAQAAEYSMIEGCLKDMENPIEQSLGETERVLNKLGSKVALFSSKDPLVTYLEVKGSAVLVHGRDWNTHESIKFDSGVYQINRQRELTPEGWRKVQD